MFAVKLMERIRKLNNPTAVGLDPDLSLVPQFCLRRTQSKAEAVLWFCRELIDHLHDIVPVVKCQSAFFEALGPEGALVLQETMEYARKKDMLVILDGKRNDIGSTAEAYAKAYLENDGYFCDALTVNPYLGYDGIQPFLDRCVRLGKGIFVLVKTSNPSSGDLQDVELKDGRLFYQHVAGLVETWAAAHRGPCGYGPMGAVLGATYPEILSELRLQMPATFFLVPGYGSQGGTPEDVARAFDRNGEGALVNASRSILRAWEKEGDSQERFALASRREAIRMRDAILHGLQRKETR